MSGVVRGLFIAVFKVSHEASTRVTSLNRRRIARVACNRAYIYYGRGVGRDEAPPPPLSSRDPAAIEAHPHRAEWLPHSGAVLSHISYRNGVKRQGSIDNGGSGRHWTRLQRGTTQARSQGKLLAMR